MSQHRDQYFSKVIEKGLRILNLFNPDCTSLSLKDISQITGINSTSTFRFVETLIQLGYLRKDPRTKLIELGPHSVVLANRLIRSSNLLQIIAPSINETYNALNVSIDCAVFEEDTLQMIYERDAKGSFSFNSPTVETALHCTSMGKAVLANLEHDEMLSVLSRLKLTKKTNKTITTKKDLLKELDRTKKRGYALNNEEYIPALVAIGAPLINSEMMRPFGAISFNFFPLQNSLKMIARKYAPAVISLAKNISEKIPSSWDTFSMFEQ